MKSPRDSSHCPRRQQGEVGKKYHLLGELRESDVVFTVGHVCCLSCILQEDADERALVSIIQRNCARRLASELTQ